MGRATSLAPAVATLPPLKSGVAVPVAARHMPGAGPRPAARSARGVTVQRKCSCGGTCGACKGREPLVLRKGAPGPAAAPNPLDRLLSRGTGAPLDASTRAFMQPRFGRDFFAV